MSKQYLNQIDLIIDEYSALYYSIRPLVDDNFSNLEDLFGEGEDILEMLEQAKKGKQVDPLDTDDFDLAIYEIFGFSKYAKEENSLVVTGIIPSTIDESLNYQCNISVVDEAEGLLKESKTERISFNKIPKVDLPKEYMTNAQNKFSHILKTPGVYSCMYVIRECLYSEGSFETYEDFNNELFKFENYEYCNDFNFNGSEPLNPIKEKLTRLSYNNKGILIPLYTGPCRNLHALQFFIFRVNEDGSTTVLARLKDKDDSKYIRPEFVDELNKVFFNK